MRIALTMIKKLMRWLIVPSLLFLVTLLPTIKPVLATYGYITDITITTTRIQSYSTVSVSVSVYVSFDRPGYYLVRVRQGINGPVEGTSIAYRVGAISTTGYPTVTFTAPGQPGLYTYVVELMMKEDYSDWFIADRESFQLQVYPSYVETSTTTSTVEQYYTTTVTVTLTETETVYATEGERTRTAPKNGIAEIALFKADTYGYPGADIRFYIGVNYYPGHHLKVTLTRYDPDGTEHLEFERGVAISAFQEPIVIKAPKTPGVYVYVLRLLYQPYEGEEWRVLDERSVKLEIGSPGYVYETKTVTTTKTIEKTRTITTRGTTTRTITETITETITKSNNLQWGLPAGILIGLAIPAALISLRKLLVKRSKGTGVVEEIS